MPVHNFSKFRLRGAGPWRGPFPSCPANTGRLRRPAVVVPLLAVPFSWRTAVRPARARTRNNESISAALILTQSATQSHTVSQ